MILSRFLCLCPILLLVGYAASADAPAGRPPPAGKFLFRDLRVAGEAHRYAVWLPPGYDPAKRWPAIVFLHGSGECGTDGERQTRSGLGPALEAHPDRWPFIVLFPQKPQEDAEWEEYETMLLAECDTLLREFPVAPAQLALVGMSQGGHGAWVLGARHAERWYCLVPVCGYGRARPLAPRIFRKPIWAFHGLLDDVVDPSNTRNLIAAVRGERAGMGLDPDSARMTLYPDANHGSWLPAFEEPELPRWIAAQAAR